jgi:hypothetical protein
MLKHCHLKDKHLTSLLVLLEREGKKERDEGMEWVKEVRGCKG